MLETQIVKVCNCNIFNQSKIEFNQFSFEALEED